MLTDLSFLGAGRIWPPVGEKARLDGYFGNRALFEGDHGRAFKAAFLRIQRGLDEAGLQAPVRYEAVVNYPYLVSVKTAGLLFPRLPGIVAGDEKDTEAMDAVQQIGERSNLYQVLYACALDVSRYGTGILLVRRNEKGEGVIELSRPDVWFPVVDAANIRRVLYHVLATPYETSTTSGGGHTVIRHYLHVETHERGFVTVQDFVLDDKNRVGHFVLDDKNRVGQAVSEPVRTETGLSDFAVIPIHNMLPSDRVYGIDDYENIQTLVCELDIRLAQMARVMDKHTAPTMQGPEDALTTNPATGDRYFMPGGFYVNKTTGSSEAGSLSYLTWDAQLDANFKMIELLIKQIRVISEMGALLSDMSENAGQVPSGSAMRRMLYSAMDKVNRLHSAFEPGMKQALVLCSELGSQPLTGKPLYINWPDSLPKDPQEMAQIASVRTGGKQTQSVKRALMMLDELDEDSAERELEVIRDEQAENEVMFGASGSKDEEEE